MLVNAKLVNTRLTYSLAACYRHIEDRVFSRRQRKTRILFALSDVLLVTLAFVVAYRTRASVELLNREFFLSPSVQVLIAAIGGMSWVLAGRWMAVYDKLDSSQALVILRDGLKQSLAAIAVIVFVQFALRLDLSRTFLLLYGGLGASFLIFFRLNARVFYGKIREKFGAIYNVVVAGDGVKALEVGRLVEQASRYGFRLGGYLSLAPKDLELDGKPVYSIEKLSEILRSQVIDEILFVVPPADVPRLENIFLLCDEEGVRTRLAIDFFPHVNSEMYLDQLGTLPMLTFSAAPHDEFRLVIKRVADVVLAGVALVLVAPLMALIAALIKLTSPGPAIFSQERCGLNGRRFLFYKFRSMCDNAEALKVELAHLNEKQTAFKIANDPRLTPVGRWLRKFSIDEWPQLWNVLRGDMSLVGPRPPVPQEVEQYKGWQRRRLRMRPGLTCLWAVCGRDKLDFDTWMRLDMEYIDNWSLVLDWKIILKTIPHVVTGKGAN